MNEGEAIRRCQSGDREAFRHLVEQYGNVLYGTAYLMTRDRIAAEDLVQETLLLAWKGIRSFQAGRPMKPWLVRILVNRLMSLRRHHFIQTTPLQGEETLGRADEPAGLAQQTETRDDVRRAITALPEEHRQVVMLRYFTDLSVPEVANVLGCPEGTVKSRLHRALEHLRRAMGE